MLGFRVIRSGTGGPDARDGDFRGEMVGGQMSCVPRGWGGKGKGVTSRWE